jgi:hypothetical protein
MPFVRSRAFGLNLNANLAIPGLVESPDGPTDVEIHLGHLPVGLNTWEREVANCRPHYVSPHNDNSGRPLLTVQLLARGQYYQFQYCDDTQFVVSREGSEVWATWPQSLSLADTATYLLGPIIGFVLRLRGQVCLHASAVVVRDSVVAFLGPMGAGKSTTAAALAQRGYGVLSDDVVVLAPAKTGFLVHPAYPQLRLWPPAVQMLYGDADALPPLTANWDKRGLNLAGEVGAFPERSLPLAAIYQLAERGGEGRRPRIESLPPQEALMALVTHTYMNYLLDSSQRAAEFALIGRLLHAVPVRLALPHEDPSQLDRLCDVLLDDCQTQSAWTPGR